MCVYDNRGDRTYYLPTPESLITGLITYYRSDQDFIGFKLKIPYLWKLLNPEQTGMGNILNRILKRKFLS